MATPTFFQTYKRDLQDGTIDADDDAFILYLTNTTPNAATMDTFADLAGITAQNGYSPITLTLSIASDGATGYRLVNDADESWTAATGSFGPFTHVPIYDDTPTVPADPLVMFWAVGSSTTITDGNSFTVDFDANFELYTLDS